MAIGVWISLIGYFSLMIAIGVYAMRTSTASSEDYMLGGRSLSPKVAALSAGGCFWVCRGRCIYPVWHQLG